MKRISTLISLAAIVVAPLFACASFVTPSVQAQRVQAGLRSLSTQQLISQSVATQTKTDLEGGKSSHDQLEAVIDRLDAINVNLGDKPEAPSESKRLIGHDQLEVIIERLDAINVNLGGKSDGTTTANRLSEHDQLEAIIKRLDAINVNLDSKPRTTPRQ